MKDFENKHYSDKGGHKERSDFWKAARRIDPRLVYHPNRELSWLIKRDMPRMPREGKR